MIYDWRNFLTKWSKEILEFDEFRKAFSAEVITSGWFGYPGASEEEINMVETRLGILLPPSYREFLQVTNGWPWGGFFVERMLSTREIEWYAKDNQDGIDIWVASQETDPTDEEYFVYNDTQIEGYFRARYLQTALQICAIYDDNVFLLNPQVVTSTGEWEAWFFAPWLPGARRSRSFWDLMQEEYKIFLYLRSSIYEKKGDFYYLKSEQITS